MAPQLDAAHCLITQLVTGQLAASFCTI